MPVDGDIRLSFPIEPVAWARMNVNTSSGRPRFIKRDKQRSFAGHIGMLANHQWRETPWTCAIKVLVIFYMARPKSPKTPKSKAWKDFPTGTPDLDNLQKAIFDALNGIVWQDDAQVVHVTAQKIYCEHEESPRIELFVGQMVGPNRG